MRKVNGASGIDRDRIGAARGKSFKGKQGYSVGFELLYEAGGAVDKIHAADRIHGRAKGTLKLARLSSAYAPFLDEFNGRRLDQRGGLRVRA